MFSKNALFCAVAGICFGIAPSIQRQLLLEGMSALSCIVAGNIALVGVCLAFCKKNRRTLRTTLKTAGLLCLVGSMGSGVTSLLLAKSYLLIPVGCATALHFLYPTVVTIAMALFFKKRMTMRLLLAIVCSVVGVFLLGFSFGVNNAGVLFAVVSSGTYAFYLVGNEKFAPESMKPYPAVVYMASATALLLLLYGAASGALSVPNNARSACLLVAYCALYAAAYVFLNIGISRAGAVNAAFATLLEPITSCVCSALITRNMSGNWGGIILILLSVWLISARGDAAASKERVKIGIPCKKQRSRDNK